jgi:hypothetical protein
MEQSLKLIVDYIHEKRGVWITPIPPQNARQQMLMMHMASIAKEYFDSKNMER